MKKYTIKKGKHSSGIHVRPFCKLHTFSGTFSLDEGSKHIKMQKDCEGDINKITGFGLGINPDINSIRLGERYIREQDHFEIWPYIHEDGKIIQSIYDDPDTYMLGTIKQFETGRFLIERWGARNFHIGFGIVGEPLKMVRQIYTKDLPKYGWVLNPYFGGNCTYPGDDQGHTSKIIYLDYKIK